MSDKPSSEATEEVPLYEVVVVSEYGQIWHRVWVDGGPAAADEMAALLRTAQLEGGRVERRERVIHTRPIRKGP